jgi:hypothetical protein
MGLFSRFRQQPEPTPKVEGLLGYYGLADWWLTAFSAQEREEIEGMWGYLILDEHPLTRGQVASNPLSAADFLMVMSTRVPEQVAQRAILPKVRAMRAGDLPGYINGKHYSVYMEQAKQLLESGKASEADLIVDMAFTGFEDKERIGGLLTEYSAVPSGNYWDFAVLYRKLKDYAREIRFLERFAGQQQQQQNTGAAAAKTLERLEKARSLRDGTAHDNQDR